MSFRSSGGSQKILFTWMVFAWPSLLLLLLLQSASAQGGPSELYGLKLDNWQVSETNLLAYQAVEDQVTENIVMKN